MTEPVIFIFHRMKISNFRHKLAFKQVVRFQSPSVYLDDSSACKSFRDEKILLYCTDSTIITIMGTERVFHIIKN